MAEQPQSSQAAKKSVKRLTVRSPKKPADLAPQKLKLLVTIVNRNKVEFFMDLLQSFHINMQFTTSASSTAGSDLLHLMGLEESEKGAIFSLVREDIAPSALQALDEKFKTIKNGKGIAFTVPLTGVIGVSIYRFLCDNRKAMKEEQ